MVTIGLTEAERLTGSLSPASVALAKKAIEEDGFVVLEDVVDPAHVALIQERMMADLPHVLNRSDAPFNFTKSNLQQDPPPIEPYLFRDVLVNEYAIQVTHAILGNGVKNNFYSGNVALPNTAQRQPTHADMGHLWADMPTATPAYALVVNLPMIDMHPGNGSTELWPGTHLDTSVALQEGDIKVTPEVLDERRKVSPPIQPVVRAGSILIRDMRLWHGGMPNPSDDPRHMVAMIHWVGWWNHSDRLTFPASSKELFDHPVLQTDADFVDGPIDYIGRNVAYDMQEK